MSCRSRWGWLGCRSGLLLTDESEFLLGHRCLFLLNEYVLEVLELHLILAENASRDRILVAGELLTQGPRLLMDRFKVGSDGLCLRT